MPVDFVEKLRLNTMVGYYYTYFFMKMIANKQIFFHYIRIQRKIQMTTQTENQSSQVLGCPDLQPTMTRYFMVIEILIETNYILIIRMEFISSTF